MSTAVGVLSGLLLLTLGVHAVLRTYAPRPVPLRPHTDEVEYSESE